MTATRRARLWPARLNMVLPLLAAGAAVTLATGMAHATYSGLLIIPTADLVAPGEYSAGLELDGTFAGHGDEWWALNAEFGVSPRLEAGLDLALTADADTRVFMDAKYLLMPDKERSPAVAAGICNVGSHLKAVPYLVASHDFGPMRAHAGVASIEGAGRWFVGADRPLSERLSVLGDYTNGSDNAASIAGYYQVTERFGITAGVVLPNDGDCDTEFSLFLTFTGPLQHSR